VEEVLQRDHKEVLSLEGALAASPKNRLQVWQSKANNTLTVVVKQPDGATCLVIAGQEMADTSI
jgi:hypothetical protein